MIPHADSRTQVRREAGGLLKRSAIAFGHRMTLAPLHANYLWIPALPALHPVQPHRQLARHGHFRNAVVPLGFQSGIHSGQVLVSSCRQRCGLH